MLLKFLSMRGLQISENFPPFRQRRAPSLSQILALSNTYNQKDACDDRLCVQITVESSQCDAARDMDHKPHDDCSTAVAWWALGSCLVSFYAKIIQIIQRQSTGVCFVRAVLRWIDHRHIFIFWSPTKLALEMFVAFLQSQPVQRMKIWRCCDRIKGDMCCLSHRPGCSYLEICERYRKMSVSRNDW